MKDIKEIIGFGIGIGRNFGRNVGFGSFGILRYRLTFWSVLLPKFWYLVHGNK
jgi:hypothetical protein